MQQRGVFHDSGPGGLVTRSGTFGLSALGNASLLRRGGCGRAIRRGGRVQFSAKLRRAISRRSRERNRKRERRLRWVVPRFARVSCSTSSRPPASERILPVVGMRVASGEVVLETLARGISQARDGEAQFYAGTSDASAPVAIYKIHGSANFALATGGGRGATVEIAQANVKPLRAVEQKPFASLYNDHPLSALGGRRNTRLSHNCQTLYRILVTYGPKKPAVHGTTGPESGLRRSAPTRRRTFGAPAG
jgi:hypothetical protein